MNKSLFLAVLLATAAAVIIVPIILRRIKYA